MHFLYIDETGDTGADLLNIQQPIFVMGGISVSDEKWNPTQQKFVSIINAYFNGTVPSGFEFMPTNFYHLMETGPLQDIIELPEIN